MSFDKNDIPFKEEEIITLEFDDNTSLDCIILGIFETNDREYIALAPEKIEGDVYIYRYQHVSNDEFELAEIFNDDEFASVAKVFNSLMEGVA